MKYIYILIVSGLLFFLLTETAGAQPADNPQKDIELVISAENGNNGMSVSWNEEKRIYYAAYGGNASYPLEIFTEEGKNIYSKEIGLDIRGMVYHEKWNCLMGNLYDNGGYYKIYLDDSGIPDGRTEIMVEGKHQPTSQSGGTFNTKRDVMYTIYDASVLAYSLEDGVETEDIELTGLTQKELESCVSGLILFTGHKGFDFMMINYLSYKLHFFNGKGNFVKSIQLDPADYISAKFNISFCNNRLWCYNKNSRKWTSYLIFH